MFEFIAGTVTRLFAIMNPIGCVPLLATLLQGVPPNERNRVIFTEVLCAFVMMSVFFLFGSSFLSSLGIQSAAIRFAGAILLGKVALRMNFPSGSEGLSSMFGLKPGEKPFLIPVAMPMLAGPGLLVSLIELSDDPKANPVPWVLLSLGLLSLLALGVLLATPFVLQNVSKASLGALERVMGLLLLILAADMFVSALGTAFPGLVEPFRAYVHSMACQGYMI